MIEIQIKNEWFRKKVLQALDVWATERPHEARAFAQQCRQYREPRRSMNKYAGSADFSPSFKMPMFPVQLLRMTEWQTQFGYGSSCGTGNREWDNDDKLVDIFMTMMPEGKISELHGSPSKRERT